MSNQNTLKVKVQSFGRFLSGMVMPNIGAFIAWGFITALFIPTGWMPNEGLSKLVGPMITYLLPLLIGYSGGKLVAGERGGVVGAIATSGVIIGTSIPMFMGAMIAGPIGGWLIKKFDEAVDGKVKEGFEMLVNNFSAGLIGMGLSLFFFKVIGPFVEGINKALGAGVQALVNMNLLPLTSIIVEPAKILFLNNAINHGVFSPLGIQQSAEAGKSLFFLIETNPGPGLGILLAFMIFGKGMAKNSAPGAAIIHFFGGIHEIYFPYVLMQPLLILAVIAGGATGVLTNVVLHGGLIAPPSPGSVFALLAMTPKGGFIATIASIITSAAVSALVGMVILKSTGSGEDNLDKATEKMKEMKNKKELSGDLGKVSKIVVACDAGMGSSAMGASLLRKKVKAAGLDISVENRAINNLTEDIDIVITHRDLTSRAKTVVKNPEHLSIDNFMNGEFYDDLVKELKKKL
jgi:PTS system mannitol-specific IIC component